MNFLSIIPQLEELFKAILQALNTLENNGVSNSVQTLISDITPGQPDSPILSSSAPKSTSMVVTTTVAHQ